MELTQLSCEEFLSQLASKAPAPGGGGAAALVGAAGAALFLAGLLLGETEYGSYIGGFGGGLTAVGLVRLLRVRRLSRDPEKAADYDASLKDERTAYVANKARSMTFFICVYVQLAAALLAILVFEQPLVGQVLCGLTCLQGLLYTVFYWHYDKVY